MTSPKILRIELPEFGDASVRNAARVLGERGGVVALIAEPTVMPSANALRDAVIRAVLKAEFGDVVLAGVAYAPKWGGDAVGFT